MTRTFGTGYKYSLLSMGGVCGLGQADALGPRNAGGRTQECCPYLRQLGSAGLRGGPEKYTLPLTLINYLETNEGRPDILSVIDGIDE